MKTPNPSKLAAIHVFYSNLYTAKLIDVNYLDEMLSYIHKQLSISNAQSILYNITYDDIIEEFKRCPRKSNPGLDGLPYEILHLVIACQLCYSIVIAF